MTDLDLLEAAWDRACCEHHNALVTYENELADRETISKAVIRQELEPLYLKAQEADAAKQQALAALINARPTTFERSE